MEARYQAIVEAVGEQEAERLIVADLGSIKAAYEHLVSIGSIELPEPALRYRTQVQGD